EGTTLIGRLDELAAEHGLYSTSQLSIRAADLSRVGAMMERLRPAPPTPLLSSPVVEDSDLSRGSAATLGLPPNEGLLLRSEDDTRVVVRPSGTEPKLKCYLEVVTQLPDGATGAQIGQIRRSADTRLESLEDELRAVLGAD